MEQIYLFTEDFTRAKLIENKLQIAYSDCRDQIERANVTCTHFFYISFINEF